ncbi:hypothetical protein [Desulfallas thermosapovorans]|uniref:Uncharacterized protein n=1 Tax=Desulfallas thermosapovorans DSM 6562 TaxID=1121431 RepID=A0A5S4ZPT9_9FIRM|nr:hypothetical protein [Desulfallas thermosapovorans]TYO94799.1 hypothetical protein LX24_02050 [Desulfallas thermosapovorans DSM 6562]
MRDNHCFRLTKVEDTHRTGMYRQYLARIKKDRERAGRLTGFSTPGPRDNMYYHLTPHGRLIKATSS